MGEEALTNQIHNKPDPYINLHIRNLNPSSLTSSGQTDIVDIGPAILLDALQLTSFTCTDSEQDKTLPRNGPQGDPVPFFPVGWGQIQMPRSVAYDANEITHSQFRLTWKLLHFKAINDVTRALQKSLH